MVTRRQFLKGAGSLALAGTGPWTMQAALAEALSGGRQEGSYAAPALSRHVDVFTGTGGHGHTFPGPSLPFGMVQLSPDTHNASWDASSGYHQGDGSIMGFSHTHLSGTGIGDMLDVLLMPAQGPVQLKAGDRGLPERDYYSRYDGVHASSPLTPEHPGRHGPGYRSGYDRASEFAQPGYYRVKLTDHDILVELTATLRTGLHRYTFRHAGEGHVLLDLAHGFQRPDPMVPAVVSLAELQVVGNDTVVGGRRVHQWADGRQIYFAMKFSRPFDQSLLYDEDAALPSGSRAAKGRHLKATLHFREVGREPLLVKVGISAVDVDGALRNLDAEMPAWEFEKTRTAALHAWEEELGRIQIESASAQTLKTFYSALYHTMLAPTLFSDTDGRYRGMDEAVHQLPQEQHNYSTYSLWDTYRTQHPLLTLYQSDRVTDLLNGLVRMTVESPDGPPVWPLQGRETGCMIGIHSAVVLAEAYVKGYKGVDYQRAWPVFRKRAMEDDYRGLTYYRKLGYIPSDEESEAVSKTLEYAYDDWAMAHLAEAAGAHDDARRLRERSRNYKNLFDAKGAFMRARGADGSWLEPFDPRGMGHSPQWRDFTESNAWQATFLNQHDLYEYIRMFGGEAAFERKLDALFDADPTLPSDAPADMAGMVGQYAHGNEPSHHMAYLYAYVGSHHKTQARVRMLLENLYQAAPDGLAGNEDCGQMSAWYVMGALGLYPVDPVSACYVFGSPLVDSAQVRVGNGRVLTITARNNAPRHPYIQSVRWNGEAWSRSWISHAELAKGGHLEFEMGPSPNEQFGKAPADRPPSFGGPADVRHA